MFSVLFLASCVLFAYNVLISTNFANKSYIMPVAVMTLFVQVMYYVSGLILCICMNNKEHVCSKLKRTNNRLYKRLQKCKNQLRKYKQYQNDYENNHFDESNNYYDDNDDQYDDENNYYYGNKNNYFDGFEFCIGDENDTFQ